VEESRLGSRRSSARWVAHAPPHPKTHPTPTWSYPAWRCGTNSESFLLILDEELEQWRGSICGRSKNICKVGAVFIDGYHLAPRLRRWSQNNPSPVDSFTFSIHTTLFIHLFKSHYEVGQFILGKAYSCFPQVFTASLIRIVAVKTYDYSHRE
jgi:hypothetical protein